jgi:hypothetical protein
MTFILSFVRAESCRPLKRTQLDPAEGGMVEYQVYVLTRTAELVEARRLFAFNDSIAVAKTATLRRQSRREVWQGDRW